MAETTIKDIARLCGVSVSTVSRAINHHPDINKETLDKVQAVIDETGFVPNNSARNLKRSESNSIALLMKGIENPFFTDVMDAIEKRADELHYGLIVRRVGLREDEVKKALLLEKERKPKGIIFLGGGFEHNEKLVKQLGVPVLFSTVSVGDKSKTPLFSSVSVDDFQAGYLAAEHLISLGHRKIAILTEELSVSSIGLLRYRGYQKALEDNGLSVDEVLVRQISSDDDCYTMKNGYLATKRMIEKQVEFTAIFCIADRLAVGAYRALSEAGLSVPYDISVVGFDGLEIGDYLQPKLTTIVQPAARLGRETVNLLVEQIEDDMPPENLVMDGVLTVKESTAEPKVGMRRSA